MRCAAHNACSGREGTGHDHAAGWLDSGSLLEAREGGGENCMVSPSDEAELYLLMPVRMHHVAVVSPQQPGLLPASSWIHFMTPHPADRVRSAVLG